MYFQQEIRVVKYRKRQERFRIISTARSPIRGLTLIRFTMMQTAEVCVYLPVANISRRLKLNKPLPENDQILIITLFNQLILPHSYL